MSVGIDLGPLREAAALMREKVPVGSAMGSREWAEVQAEIRLRAMFSARVESERLLVDMQKRLQVRVELGRKDGRTMDRGVFIEEMRDELRRAGFQRGEARRDSLQDLKSTRRLGLIWDMNVAMAQGYARWTADMRPEDLAVEPCYELIREEERQAERNWPEIWAEAGGEFFDGPGSNDDYPEAPGRMIAKKTDEIWVRISRFGTPWAPFDWGSGMGLRGVSREEADAFGITAPDDTLAPLAIPFNSSTQASARAIPEEGRESLRSEFGDAIAFDADNVQLQRDGSPETYEQRRQDISESLRERARAIADEGREVLRTARSEDGPLAESPGPWEDAFDEILASTAAVATGRKQLYHEGWGDDAAVVAGLLRLFLPAEVAVMERAGHVHAWRSDLLKLTPDEIQALSEQDKNGILLGYGQNLFDKPSVPVNFRTQEGKIIGGFFANPETALVFAKARRRDFTDALGKPIRLFIDGKEVEL